MPILFGDVTDDDYNYRRQYVEWRLKYDELNFFDNNDELISGLSSNLKSKKDRKITELVDYIVTYYPIEQVVVISCNGFIDNDGNMIIPRYIESIKGVTKVIKGHRIIPEYPTFKTNRKRGRMTKKS